MTSVNNPVIKGFNPDPSVCRVENTYYLVTSTFEFFPGITIYKSENLVNWEIVGHGLTDESLALHNCRPSGGLYAPTIRYHDGYFFITCTNVTDKGNFVIYSEKINGPWKGPYWIKQGGIDPSLFFDEDGKCYLASSSEWDGKTSILQCEIDPFSGKQLSESRLLTIGTGGKYPEAPHMYKIGEYYYLVLAEGGTEYGHMVTIQRADNPWGPFEKCPYNPILSHRGRNAQYSPFQCVGHADIIEDSSGNWWMVSLGIRPLPGVLLHNLGRETFLSRVSWTDDKWPLINTDGLLTETIEIGYPVKNDPIDFSDDFEKPVFSHEYLFLRNPRMENFIRDNGKLTLIASDSINSNGSPTIACIRQKDFIAHCSVELDVDNSDKPYQAGISIYYCRDQHYDLYIENEDEKTFIVFRRTLYDIVQLEKVQVDRRRWTLKIDSDKESYSFSAVDKNRNRISLGKASVFGICTEISSTMTFTGAMFSLFCEIGSATFRNFNISYTL